MHLWETPDWPALTWDERSLARLLAHVSREQGRLPGKMEALGFDLRSEAHLRTLTEDVVKSSEIEGERHYLWRAVDQDGDTSVLPNAFSVSC